MRPRRYHDDRNIVYLGGYKYRDGINRNMTGNLMLQSLPVFQVYGFPWDYFDNNYIVGSGRLCGPQGIGGLSGNTFITLPKDEARPGVAQNSVAQDSSGGGSTCVDGPVKQWTLQQLEALARALVGIA